MAINTDKIRVIIIKYQRITCDILESIFILGLIQTIELRKGLTNGINLTMDLENSCKYTNRWHWEMKKLLFETLLLLLSYMDVKFGDISYLDNHGEG